PDGADAVVPQEDVDARDGVIALRGTVAPGAFVRPAGEDVREGDLVLEPGRPIGAAEIGILATLGRTQVTVGRRPRVAVLSTGNELADLGTEPTAAQIPNANTYSLMAQIVEAGGLPLNLGVAPDRLDAIAERIARGTEADMLVSSAGVSVGELDLVREALVNAGADLHLWKVDMRPGKPITFGSLAGKPVFGLPGNPVSAMVTFELFVRPMLLAIQGRRGAARPIVRATALATGCASRGSVRQVQDDLAGLHADVSELRHSYELSARELARMMEELRALDARNAELQAAIREQGAEAARLRARLDAAEQELR